MARLDLIKSYQGLTTLEWHGPKVDFYLNAGAEYASRAAGYDAVTNKYVGYGSPLFNNTGCFTETGPGAGGFLPGALSNCTADTRVLIEGTAGFWYKLYDGSKEKVNRGRIQFGPQYLLCDPQCLVGFIVSQRTARNRQHDLHVVPLLPAVTRARPSTGTGARTEQLCPGAGFLFFPSTPETTAFCPLLRAPTGCFILIFIVVWGSR